jgi:hypothetical protein
MIDNIKNIAITIASISGVLFFVIDNTISENRLKREASIGYVSEMRSDRMIENHQNVINFWQLDISREFLSLVDEGGEIPAVVHQQFFDVILGANADITVVNQTFFDSLFDYAFFYDEVWFCRASGNCDERILDDFFCDDLPYFNALYRPFYDNFQQNYRMQSLSMGLRNYSSVCENQV